MSLSKIEREAFKFLEDAKNYPGLPSRDQFVVKVILKVYPSFPADPMVTWTVLENSGQFYLRRISWNRIKSISSPVVYGSEAAVDSQCIELVNTLLAVVYSLPAKTVEASNSIDGTICGIAANINGTAFDVSWNTQAPTPELVRSFDQCVGLFRNILP